MAEGLLLVGLVLCRVGFAYQLRRDWLRHGLSYVRGETLLALMLGSSALAAWALLHGYPLAAAASIVPGIVDAGVAWLKTRDWLRTRRYI